MVRFFNRKRNFSLLPHSHWLSGLSYAMATGALFAYAMWPACAGDSSPPMPKLIIPIRLHGVMIRHKGKFIFLYIFCFKIDGVQSAWSNSYFLTRQLITTRFIQSSVFAVSSQRVLPDSLYEAAVSSSLNSWHGEHKITIWQKHVTWEYEKREWKKSLIRLEKKLGQILVMEEEEEEIISIFFILFYNGYKWVIMERIVGSLPFSHLRPPG
jgi:hypothetical protein